jgi:formylglycine-generating enzyme required for sulfatase activity
LAAMQGEPDQPKIPFVPCRSGNGYDQSAVAMSSFPWPPAQCNDGHPQTSPVGTFLPNLLGVYDSVGNVWQWTQTCAVLDQTPCQKYVLKGGSWASPTSALTADAVLLAEPTLHGATMGFRVWRDGLSK